MEATEIVVNEISYYICHIYTNPYYGTESVYHILTKNEKWAKSDIEKAMNAYCREEIESKGLHDLNYKRKPCIENALKPYYTLEFKDNDEVFNYSKYGFDGYYRYVYKRPYDD